MDQHGLNPVEAGVLLTSGQDDEVMRDWPVGSTSEPTVTLTGNELDGVSGATLFDRAEAYFKANLRGQYDRPGVGKVGLTGRTWQKLKGGLPYDDLKAKCIPAMPEIIARGGAKGQWMPLNKMRSDDLKAFLYVGAKVRIGEVVANVVVSIGRGKFADRGHNLVAKTKMDSVLPQKFGRGSESISVGLSTDDLSLPEPGEDFNLIIVSVTQADDAMKAVGPDGLTDAQRQVAIDARKRLAEKEKAGLVKTDGDGNVKVFVAVEGDGDSVQSAIASLMNDPTGDMEETPYPAWDAPANVIRAMTDEQFRITYGVLEDQNHHPENVILMALRYGDAGDVAEARKLLEEQIAAGGLAGDMYERRKALHMKLSDARDRDASKSDSVEISGDELGEYPETEEGRLQLRAAASAFLDGIAGKWFDCPALGGEVEIRKSGNRKLISLSVDVRKLKMVKAIPMILRKARKIKTRTPYNGEKDKSAKAYHILRAKIAMAGEPMSARIIVKEDVNGKFHYDMSVVSRSVVLDSANEEGQPEGQPTTATSDDGGTDPSRLASGQLDSSVDENGNEGKLDGVSVNSFDHGDKVFDSDTGKNYTVVRQEGWRVLVAEKPGVVIHANRLKPASGSAARKVVLDSVGYQYEFNRSLDNPAYAKKVKIKGYGGPINVFQANSARDMANVLIGSGGDWSKQDHASLASKHDADAQKNKIEWSKVAYQAAQDAWGRDYRVSDYKVSGIASSEFKTEFKEKLRELAQAESKHKTLAVAHAAAAKSKKALDSVGETEFEDDLSDEEAALDAVRGGTQYVMNLFVEGVDIDADGNPIGEIAMGIESENEDLSTEQGITRALQVSVAKLVYELAMKNADKYPATEVERVRAKALAEYEQQTGGTAIDMHVEIAQAIVGKDAKTLIKYFVNGNFEASEGVFERATGLKIRRLASAKKEELLKDWAGWTEEQKTEYADAMAKAETEKAARYAAEGAERARKNIIGVLEYRKYRTDNDEIVSARELIDRRIAEGYVSLEESKRGAAKKWTLWNRDSGRGMPLKDKTEAEYARMALAGLEVQPASNPESVSSPAAVDESSEKKKAAAKAMLYLGEFMSRGQKSAVRAGLAGEEAEFFLDKMIEMAELVRTMPKVYGQDGKGDQAIAYLHYFKGGMDWYITEKDSEEEQLQAFGLADLGHGFPEIGYINLVEVTQIGAELDLHWTPKTLDEIKGNGESNPQGASLAVNGDVGASEDAVVVDYESAKEFFKRELQGKVVKTKAGDVHIIGSTWREMKRGLKSDSIKARLFPHIMSILSGGAYLGREELNKERNDGYIAFHFFESDGIDLMDMTVDAGVTVAERENGELEFTLSAYGLGHSMEARWAKRKGVMPISGQEPEDTTPASSGNRNLEQTLDDATSDVNTETAWPNLVILNIIQKEAGEREALPAEHGGGANTESDRDFLQSVIDNKVDATDPDLPGRIEAIYGQASGDEALMKIWLEALAAFQKNMMAALTGATSV